MLRLEFWPAYFLVLNEGCHLDEYVQYLETVSSCSVRKNLQMRRKIRKKF